MKGTLIVCEGIDGSGKSTVARALVEALRARGVDARPTVEPTPTWLGQAVRRGFTEDIDPWSEALLFMADHATHVRDTRRLLDGGAVVVSDRWSLSTFAYQGAVLETPSFDAVQWLQRTESPFDMAPDLTLLFDLDPVVALERVGRRGATEKFEKREFLEKVRRNYLRLAKEAPERFAVLDAGRTPDVVLADALATVQERLRIG